MQNLTQEIDNIVSKIRDFTLKFLNADLPVDFDRKLYLIRSEACWAVSSRHFRVSERDTQPMNGESAKDRLHRHLKTFDTHRESPSTTPRFMLCEGEQALVLLGREIQSILTALTIDDTVAAWTASQPK